MKSIKLFVLVCVVLSFSQCKTMKLTEKAPFVIAGATYHDWVGGQPGVSGTNLIIAVNPVVDFKKVYFHNKENDVSIETRDNKKYLVVNLSTSAEKILVTKTTTTINGGVVMSDKRDKPKIQRETIPFNLEKNEAVISYMVGNKTYYYKVSNIKKTETIFYP